MESRHNNLQEVIFIKMNKSFALQNYSNSTSDLRPCKKKGNFNWMIIIGLQTASWTSVTSPVLKCPPPPESPDHNPIETSCYKAEKNRNSQQTCSNWQIAILSKQSKITERCFQYLVGVMPRRTKAVLKTKGGSVRVCNLPPREEKAQLDKV